MFTAHSKEKIPGKIRRGGSNYKIKYKIEWEPPQTQAKNLTASGAKKDGIIYKGPYLFSYLEKDFKIGNNLFKLLSCLIICPFLTVLLWPYLWSDPVSKAKKINFVSW